MIERNNYLEKLERFIDKPFVKVITGLRRSGKSSLLLLLKDLLLGKEIPDNQIIYINFESFEYSNIDSPDLLYAFVKQTFLPGKKIYILLDEIQRVNSWEKAVNAFMTDFDADIYITGSNSQLLSSELATFLAGRYIEIPVFTLSFGEYILFRGSALKSGTGLQNEEFTRFLRLGGFPAIHLADYELNDAYKIIYDIYSSVILRDTVQRFGIRDVELLERVIRYIFDNIGNKFSAKNVADYFKSQQRKIDLNTVYNYLNALESAFIVYKIPRYDVKGKEILKTNEKYYLGDQSLLYATMGYKDRMISGVLENLVLLELLRRDYKVYVGKTGSYEIDFVAERRGARIYIQVAYKLTEPTTIDREFRPLLEIRDQYPKYVVTMDPLWKDDIEGVRHVYISDFLLLDNY
jgi:uncharacterized protein